MRGGTVPQSRENRVFGRSVTPRTPQTCVTHIITNPLAVKISPLDEDRDELLDGMVHRRLDGLLELVADRRRRILIELLRRKGDGLTTIEELVADLDRDEFARNTDRPPDPEALAIRLHHIHIPKLEEFGLVEYELVSGNVRYLPNEELEAVLDSLPEERAAPNA